jgi:SAM-dependent methyltransferase
MSGIGSTAGSLSFGHTSIAPPIGMDSGNQLPPGDIVRAPQSVFGDRVFFVSSGRRHWIRDGKWFAQHGRVWPDAVRDIAPELLESYLPGGPAPLVWSDEEFLVPPAGLGSLDLREIAGRNLRGVGVEFGAGASPYPVPLGCRVLFADRLAHGDLTEEIYPGQIKQDLVKPDLVTDFDTCAGIAKESMDFVIACHVIEHTRNPIGAIVQAWKRLRPGGSLVLAIPARDRTFDRDREITPLPHLIADYKREKSMLRRMLRRVGIPDRHGRMRDYAHYEEFYARAFRVPESEYRSTVDARFAENYAIHYHVWTYESFLAMVDWIRSGPAPFASVWSHPGGADPERDIEFHCVLTK